MKVMEFQGNSKSNASSARPTSLPVVQERDLTASPDVPLAILKRKLMKTNDIAVAQGYLKEISTHLKVHTFRLISLCTSYVLDLLLSQ